MEFSRQECWSELPFPPPGDLPDPGIEPGSPALQADSLPTEPPRKPSPFFRGGGIDLTEGTFQQYISDSLRGIFFLKCEFLPN